MSLGRPNQGRGEAQARGKHESQGESVNCFGRQTLTDYSCGRWCKRVDIKMDFKERGCEFAQWIFCFRSGPVVEIFKHNDEFIYLKKFSNSMQYTMILKTSYKLTLHYNMFRWRLQPPSSSLKCLIQVSTHS
jgi:hypothetical protein